MIIESTNNDKIKYFKKIRIKKYIDEEHKFIVEGYHLVEEAIKSKMVLEIILDCNETYNTNIKTTLVTENVMKSISLLDSSVKIMAVCKTFEEKEDLGNKYIILDDVQDPSNIGAIIRNAVAFNASTIVFSNNSSSMYNDKLIRASQGMIFHINMIKRDLNVFLKEIKKDVTIIGTDMNGSTNLEELKDIKSYALIMGNEGKGMSELSESLCDKTVKIEMNSNCESLNVSVSNGIILYHLR